MAEINITPLTDVMLVLLIIFTMLSALVLPPGFQKQLASGDEAYPAPPSRTVEVLVNDNDRIFVEGRPSDLAHIYVAMRDLAIRRGRVHIALTAYQKVRYGVIIRVLDAAKVAGLNDVGFVSS
jgi:biopolymer transport protein ExbD